MNADSSKHKCFPGNLLNLTIEQVDQDTLDDLLDSKQLGGEQLANIQENYNQTREFFVRPQHIKILASSRKYLTEEEE